MFLRKLLSKENRFSWIIIDLGIVIIGVYCAFLIQNYSDEQKNKNEQEKILSALKHEIEFFRYRMSETSLGMKGKFKKLKKIYEKDSYSNFSDYRFIEPQYEYQTIEYALKILNNEIIDFELYTVLQSLFVEIKKIEHVERLLTETSRRYKSLPDKLTGKSISEKLIKTENFDNFKRFITLINDRAEISSRVSTSSSNALPLINTRLGNEKTKSIEKEILLKHLPYAKNENHAIRLGKKFFPTFTEKEIKQFYNQLLKKK